MQFIGGDPETVAPYRVYWMEECLSPHDFEGFGRLRDTIKSTRIATGEHVYFRYFFRHLQEHDAAAIWQPDIHCKTREKPGFPVFPGRNRKTFRLSPGFMLLPVADFQLASGNGGVYQ